MEVQDARNRKTVNHGQSPQKRKEEDMKKFLAMLLALVMVMGMSVTVFAAESVPITPVKPLTMEPSITEIKSNGKFAQPSANDKVNVRIGGITGNPTVTLYQIASADYGKDGREGFIQYKWVEANEINFQEATSGQIAEIANAIVNGQLRVNPFAEDQIKEADASAAYTYTKEVPAGVYIAVLTGAEDGSVYNPILLTATYSMVKEDNETGAVLVGGGINAADAHYLKGAAAVAKKSTPSINKTINSDTVEPDNTITGTTPAEGTNTTSTPGPTTNATVSVGDVVGYTITPEMPSYPAEARNKALAISDRATEGLTFQFDTLEMVLDGRLEVTKSAADANGVVTFTYDNKVIAYAKAVTKNNTTGFDMTFNYDNLIHGNEGAVYVPTITYTAVVNDKAVVGKDGNTNTTTLYYTNQPNTGSDWDPATVTPPTGNDVEEKTDKEVVYTYQIAFHKTGEGTEANGLANAVFGIYSDAACTDDTLVDIVTTNDKGYAVSSQVSAGKYYIKEMIAPMGYSLNDDVFEVEAQWTSATTTIKETTVTRRTYTATKPSEDAVQVGWLDLAHLDADNKAVFYKLSTDEGFVKTARLTPAYLASETITVSNDGAEFVETNDVTGTVTELKNLMKGETSGTTQPIPNTKLTALPSTGGIGTTIFTFGGCAIMIIAAGLYFATRRKSAK